MVPIHPTVVYFSIHYKDSPWQDPQSWIVIYLQPPFPNHRAWGQKKRQARDFVKDYARFLHTFGGPGPCLVEFTHLCLTGSAESESDENPYKSEGKIRTPHSPLNSSKVKGSCGISFIQATVQVKGDN